MAIHRGPTGIASQRGVRYTCSPVPPHLPIQFSPCLMSNLLNSSLYMCTMHAALKQFLLTEGIPVDHLVVKAHIPKDRRHQSKPNTAVLFAASPFKRCHYVQYYVSKPKHIKTAQNGHSEYRTPLYEGNLLLHIYIYLLL